MRPHIVPCFAAIHNWLGVVFMVQLIMKKLATLQTMLHSTPLSGVILSVFKTMENILLMPHFAITFPREDSHKNSASLCLFTSLT